MHKPLKDRPFHKANSLLIGLQAAFIDCEVTLHSTVNDTWIEISGKPDMGTLTALCKYHKLEFENTGLIINIF